MTKRTRYEACSGEAFGQLIVGTISDIAGLLITCRAGSPRIVKVANKLNKPALPITNSLRYAAPHYQFPPLRSAHYPLPITHYPLPITNSLRYAAPITNYQLPILFFSKLLCFNC
ncbi:MAG: hypothetical protein HC942_23420 [Microcoleus sp. SU_5_6]|nr:hypothetical protein [Microcoleus sp. SU_5_6]